MGLLLACRITTHREKPKEPAPQPRAPATDPIEEVAAGGDHSCIRFRSGKVACWGSGAQGQLGNGSFGDSARPLPVLHLSDASALSLGEAHSCALRQTGEVACWGANTHSQLGAATPGARSARPASVAGVTNAIRIRSGNAHTCVVDRAERLTCWGSNRHQQIAPGRTAVVPPTTIRNVAGVTDVAAGEGHTCVTRKTGSVLCWGRGDQGQLGTGRKTSSSNRPRAVPDSDSATQIVAGHHHTCIRERSGQVSCWGANRDQQAATNTRRAIVPLTRIHMDPVAEVAAGSQHSCARLQDGRIQCWGSADSGRLGSMSTTKLPVQVANVRGAREVAVGAAHSCARLADQSVLCWGKNTGGALGNGRPGPSSGTRLSRVKDLRDVVQLASGQDFTCARRQNGQVACWGRNDTGQLGNGHDPSSNVPITPSGLAQIIDVATGAHHACALTSQAHIKCWGASSRGQLGQIKELQRAPTPIKGLRNPVELSASHDRTCARARDGTIACWGGDAEPGNNSPRKDLKESTGLSALATGWRHNCAILRGSVRCWGDNDKGQLGNGVGARELGPRPTPVAVKGLVDAQQVALGRKHSCARRMNGAVVCWGDSSAGQLGAGVSGFWTTRVPVSGITTAIELRANDDLTCAVLRTGDVRCWGQADHFNGSQPAARPVAIPTSGSVRGISLGPRHGCALRHDGTVECLVVTIRSASTGMAPFPLRHGPLA